MDKNQFFDFLKFSSEREIKTLGITYLNQFEDFMSEIEEYLPEDFDVKKRQGLIRKRILDNMNNVIRHQKESIDKINDFFV